MRNKHDMYDIRNWKPTKLKSFECYVCMPPLGTTIYNDNTQMRETTDADNKFVLCYPNGMLQVISTNYFLSRFKTPGYYVTESYLDKYCIIDQLMNWHDFEHYADSEYKYFAMKLSSKEFIDYPVYGSIANTRNAEHGDGDYIVCKSLDNGTPDFSNIFIVNGLLFPYIYDLTHFRLSRRMRNYVNTINKIVPSPLFEPVKRKTFIDHLVLDMKNAGIKVIGVDNKYLDTSLDINPPDMSWHIIGVAYPRLFMRITRDGQKYTLDLCDRLGKDVRKKELITVNGENRTALVNAAVKAFTELKLLT